MALIDPERHTAEIRRPRRRQEGRVSAAGFDSGRPAGTGRNGYARPRSRLYAALRAGPRSTGHPTARPPNGAPRDTRQPHEPETASGFDQPPQSRRYRPGHGPDPAHGTGMHGGFDGGSAAVAAGAEHGVRPAASPAHFSNAPVLGGCRSAGRRVAACTPPYGADRPDRPPPPPEPRSTPYGPLRHGRTGFDSGRQAPKPETVSGIDQPLVKCRTRDRSREAACTSPYGSDRTTATRGFPSRYSPS